MGVTAIGHAMLPASTDVVAVAASGDHHRIPILPDRVARPGAVHRREGIGTARASKEPEGAGRPAPGVGRPWGATSGLSVDDGVPCGVGVLPRAPGPGRSSRPSPVVCLRSGCQGRVVLQADHYVSGGSPHRGVGRAAGVDRRGGGLHARVPAFPALMGRSWGRVVPCGPQAAVRRTRARMGVDPVTVVLHYVCTKHPGGVGRTSSDCPRDHEFSVPDGPHRAGRTRSEAWMGGGGGGPGGEVGGVAFFAIWGCDRGDGRAGGSLSPFPSLRGGSCRCIRGDR